LTAEEKGGALPIEIPFKTDYDFAYLRSVLTGESSGGPVPIMELFADPEIMSAVTGIDYPAARAVEIFHNTGSLQENPAQMEMGIRLMDLSVAFSRIVGYDYVTVTPIVPLQRTRHVLLADTDERRQQRAWQDEGEGIIRNQSDFKAYSWPTPEQISMLPIDYVASVMEPGMKAVVLYTGIFEDLKHLMGLEKMAIQSIDAPGLVEDVLEGLTRVAEHVVNEAAAHPATGAIFYGEDMGFNTGLFMSPAFMRTYVLPRIQRIADACHRHGKLFLLHSCGQITAIMDDLIDTIGIDAKHSFEDKVVSVEEFYRKYGDRIAIIGGLDMDLMARGTVEAVRARTRKILECCAPGGRYCAGTGNSVANYIVLDNYYAMLDEVRKWNKINA
jgi:uroporphyrinogen decarboxylase